MKLGEHPFVAERTEHDALGARHVQRLEAGLLDAGEQNLRGLGRGFGLENDDRDDNPGTKAKRNPPGGGSVGSVVERSCQRLFGHRQADTPVDALRHQLLPGVLLAKVVPLVIVCITRL
jgi:hypothetical protein